MTDSADQNQLAFEANSSGSTLQRKTLLGDQLTRFFVVGEHTITVFPFISDEEHVSVREFGDYRYFPIYDKEIAENLCAEKFP